MCNKKKVNDPYTLIKIVIKDNNKLYELALNL